MKQLKLFRVTEFDKATFGVLTVNGQPRWLTLERPWLDNEKKVSCIPLGKYKVLPRYSPKFGPTWEVQNVPNRSHILFHAGNVVSASLGCILLGGLFGKLDNQTAILRSKAAFEEFLAELKEDTEVELVIVSAFGGEVH
jgi:hypothetical protein